MKKDDSELFEKMHIAGKLAARTLDELTPVSYTHLTLPTKA